MKYVRANRLGRVRWGVLDGDVIRLSLIHI